MVANERTIERIYDDFASLRNPALFAFISYWKLWKQGSTS
jgi:hypothetical protein